MYIENGLCLERCIGRIKARKISEIRTSVCNHVMKNAAHMLRLGNQRDEILRTDGVKLIENEVSRSIAFKKLC